MMLLMTQISLLKPGIIDSTKQYNTNQSYYIDTHSPARFPAAEGHLVMFQSVTFQGQLGLHQELSKTVSRSCTPFFTNVYRVGVH